MNRGRGPEPLYSDEQCSALRKEYESGKTLKALTEQEGVSRSTIYRALEKAGATMRPRGKTRQRPGILGWLDS